MRIMTVFLLLVCMLAMPHNIYSQRLGYGIGMSPSGGVHNMGSAAISAGAPAPAMPALPSLPPLLPAAPPLSLESLPLNLTPLDLRSFSSSGQPRVFQLLPKMC